MGETNRVSFRAGLDGSFARQIGSNSQARERDPAPSRNWKVHLQCTLRSSARVPERTLRKFLECSPVFSAHKGPTPVEAALVWPQGPARASARARCAPQLQELPVYARAEFGFDLPAESAGRILDRLGATGGVTKETAQPPTDDRPTTARRHEARHTGSPRCAHDHPVARGVCVCVAREPAEARPT